MKYVYIIYLIFTVCFSSCVDLDRYPEDALSDNVFFQNESDYMLYVNGLLSSVTRNNTQNRWSYETADNQLNDDVNSSFMRHSNSGQAAVTNKDNWNNVYDNIRKVNYLIQNKDKIGEGNDAADQYIGEAYYIRAIYYFNLLRNFGEVPYITEVLNSDDEMLYNTRSSRDSIATKILEDLDIAISLLDWKNKGKAKPGRINKESALLIKTRVALFEGTWEYYHGNKNTPFKVEGSNGFDFLKKAVEAGDVLIAYQGDKIYKGSAGREYSDYFNREDYTDIDGAFYYKIYDAAYDLTNQYARGTLSGFAGGVTHELVTSYLMKDGKPESISPITYDKTSQASLIDARDPRLNQTVYSPARGGFVDTYNLLPPSENSLNTAYLPLTLPFQGIGGYRYFKGTVFTAISLDISNCDDLILRYEEALLNYAEAKAILGTITQNDIDKTVNLCRNRVGMVPMNLTEVNGWGVAYSVKEGYDESASNIINAVRQERRVELALEGFRTDDLKRWAIFEDVINGYKPRGAYYQEMADYFDDEEALIAEGIPAGKFKQMKFVKGTNVGALGDYVNPYYKNADLSESGRGYYIDPKRDYLQSIPQNEIDHYLENNVVLTQNPGWF